VIGRAEQDNARDAEGGRHVGGTAVVSDEDGGFGEQCFGGLERTANGLVGFERRDVVMRTCEDDRFDVPEIEIAGDFAEAFGTPLFIGC